MSVVGGQEALLLTAPRDIRLEEELCQREREDFGGSCTRNEMLRPGSDAFLPAHNSLAMISPRAPHIHSPTHLLTLSES